MPLRSFANLKLVLSRHRKELRRTLESALNISSMAARRKVQYILKKAQQANVHSILVVNVCQLNLFKYVSPTLLGPVLGWSQQRYLRFLKSLRYFKTSYSCCPRHLPVKKGL